MKCLRSSAVAQYKQTFLSAVFQHAAEKNNALVERMPFSAEQDTCSLV